MLRRRTPKLTSRDPSASVGGHQGLRCGPPVLPLRDTGLRGGTPFPLRQGTRPDSLGSWAPILHCPCAHSMHPALRCSGLVTLRDTIDHASKTLITEDSDPTLRCGTPVAWRPSP